MSNWSAGYVSDVGYTFGYYPELNPLRLKLAFLSMGLVSPDIGVACELGFGQGVSVNIHAAASSTEWHGTDFNPSQASFSQELAAASGANVKLRDEAFADFANRSDLPNFDYIGLHGIWSWISDENRAVIVDFVRRKLNVGGVLYISYNTMPGWAAFSPMRYLMTEHAQTLGAEGCGIVSRVDRAIDFAEKLLATHPAYARANPLVADRIKKLKGQNRNYLAHEYFNRDWHPMHFSAMAKLLESAKLQYGCSAHFLDHIDSINLTVEQQAFLRDIPDLVLRESVRDFMVNQQFRRDYWVKGVRKLNVLEQAELLRAQKVILVRHRSDISLKVSGALGEATMSEIVYGTVLNVLADYKPKTLGEIEQALKEKNLPLSQITQALIVLTGVGAVAVVLADAPTSNAKTQTDRINKYFLEKARGSGDIGYLASTVTGGGIPVERFSQLFVHAISLGKKQPAEWAAHAWLILAGQGQRVVKGGVVLESSEANVAELTAQATSFSEKQLPILKALRVV